ncbi:hypothetical protein [Streptomyces glomeratus]|uniref:hypothetical protein n=1 Tax=Streptomyces glomeratus TaxID=284452 RepID=UPI001F1AD564|nr:hypothetical protein [Streptomyces glomeratus]MCF1509705.1 hypothetical protein [Streptomyces glomeratus]
MDHFEQELARMMRDSQEYIPFASEQRERLREGVRARRRLRAATVAGGSVLLVAGLTAGLFLLPKGPAVDRPQGPLTRPGTSSSSSPAPSTSSPAVSPTQSHAPGTPTGTGTTGGSSPPSTFPSGSVDPTTFPPNPPATTATAPATSTVAQGTRTARPPVSSPPAGSHSSG